MSDDYKSFLKRKERERLEKTSLTILTAMKSCETFTLTDNNELIRQSITLAKEFIKQIDGEKNE